MGLHIAVRIIVAVAAAVAATLWYYSSRIDVPDDIDAIVGELQRIGYWNGWAALASCIAAAFGALDVVMSIIGD